MSALGLLLLGWLLSLQGRLARGGRLRDVVPRLRSVLVVGLRVSVLALLFVPPVLLFGVARDAAIIAPAGHLDLLFFFLAAAALAPSLLLALRWGRPLAQRFSAIDCLQAIRLAVVGGAGTFLWLAPPSALLALSTRPMVGVLGGLALAFVASWLPFLQVHFARTGRIRALFELSEVRALAARAPVTWLVSFVVFAALTLPIQFVAVRPIPPSFMLLVGAPALLAVYLARLAVALGYRRAVRQGRRANRWLRSASRLAWAPLAVLYVFLLFLSPLVTGLGAGALFVNHGFLLPLP